MDVEKAVLALGSKLDHMLSISKVRQNDDDMNASRDVEQLSGRIDRVEMLLFRTSLDEFQALDQKIAKLMPKMLTRFRGETESERSPSTAEIFDISSKCDDEDQTSESEAEKQIEEIEVKPEREKQHVDKNGDGMFEKHDLAMNGIGEFSKVAKERNDYGEFERQNASLLKKQNRDSEKLPNMGKKMTGVMPEKLANTSKEITDVKPGKMANTCKTMTHVKAEEPLKIDNETTDVKSDTLPNMGTEMTDVKLDGGMKPWEKKFEEDMNKMMQKMLQL